MSSSQQPADSNLVRRERLPLPRPYLAPRTPTEEKLAEIWRTALSMDRVGVEDRYHELGGDSFLATIILQAMAEAFPVSLQMSVFADSPTISELGLKIDRFAQNTRVHKP
jgi:hypothetical protein